MIKQKEQPLIRFVTINFEMFDVVNKDGTLRYMGRVLSSKPALKDSCTCMIFTIKNTAEYVEKKKHAFQCKHIREARRIRYEELVNTV